MHLAVVCVRMQAGRNKAVYVLPAFEAHGDNVSHSAALADSLALQSKQKLVRS